MPLLVALGISELQRGTWLYVLAAILAFLSHEPFVLLLGQRGARAKRDHGVLASAWLVTLLASALVLGLIAFVFAPPQARIAMAICSVAFLCMFALASFKRERSLGGEVACAVAFACVGAPIILTGGRSWEAAALVTASFALANIAGVVGVKGIIEQAKTGAKNAGWLGLVIIAIGISVVALFSRSAALAAALFYAAVLFCRVALGEPKKLRLVGWSLLAASLSQAVTLYVSLR